MFAEVAGFFRLLSSTIRQKTLINNARLNGTNDREERPFIRLHNDVYAPRCTLFLREEIPAQSPQPLGVP